MLFDSYEREMDVKREGDDGCCSSGLRCKTLRKNTQIEMSRALEVTHRTFKHDSR